MTQTDSPKRIYDAVYRELMAARAEIERLRALNSAANIGVGRWMGRSAAAEAEIERLNHYTERLRANAERDANEIERLQASLKMTNGGERELSAFLKQEAEVKELRDEVARLKALLRRHQAAAWCEEDSDLAVEARAALEDKP